MIEIVDSKPSATERLFHYLVVDFNQNEQPLVTAATMEEMIQHGADVDHVNRVSKKTLLQYAIEKRSHAAASMLLSHGASPNAPTPDPSSHLLIMAAQSLPSIIPALLNSGANVMMTLMKGDITSTVGERCVAELETNISGQPPEKVAELNGMIWEKMEQMASQRSLKFTADADEPQYTTIGDWAKLRQEIDKERNETRLHYLKVLHETGPSRRHAGSPDLDGLGGLLARFPNFAEVIQELENHVLLFNLSKRKSLTMPPILMMGEAGIGKTRFVSEVAKVLALEFRKISCGTLTAGWVIGGSSTSWNEGKPGQVHLALRDGKTINPLIMLDEIDKISGDSRFDPYGPLYPLLERHTARDFTDEAVGIPLDCSFINWIATANSLEPIPDPIQSRFTICHVETPNKSQMLTICRSIYRDLLDENKDTWGERFAPELNEEVTDMLSGETPRKIREKLMRAFGQAARSRDEEIFVLRPDDVYNMSTIKRPRIGFV